MRPANFPARKDARRQRALQRWNALTIGAEGVHSTEAERNAHCLRLYELLSPSARTIRTKKDRSSRGRFAR